MHLLPAILVSGLCLSSVANAHPSHHRRWRSRSDSVDESSNENVERAFRDAFGRVSRVNEGLDAKLVARPLGSSGTLQFAPRSPVSTRSTSAYSAPSVVPSTYKGHTKHTSATYASDIDKILAAQLHPHKINDLATSARPKTWHPVQSYSSKPPKSSTSSHRPSIPTKPSHVLSTKGLSTYVASTSQDRKAR